ncbi:hypothetical protein [Archangium sp.]|uniref:NACHT domain-containing protein n=1 Tax=Archangium sp. TaxID=1872627 RepID=UPI00389AED9D
MKPEEAQALALEVLQGKSIFPRPPPHRRALAKALPLAAEALRCTKGTDLESARQGLTKLWLALAPDQLQQEEFGTPQLGAGCQEAAELLCLELPPKTVPSRHPQLPPRDINLSSFRRKLSRPRVLVPLANEAPARVFHTTWPGPTSQDEPARDTALLVERFLGVGAPRWALDLKRPPSGRSMMAALFVRALLEQWPEAAMRLVPGWRDRDEFPALGFTGELDTEGLAVPVGELEEKIRQFFSCYPEGRLFVPDTQWRQARLIFEKLPAPKKESYRFSKPRREELLQPFRGALDLLVRLGIATPHRKETQLFEKLRQAALKVPCWNGAILDVSQTLDLRLEWVAPSGNGAPEHSTLDEAGFLAEVHRGWHSGRAYPACIEGAPGSGKSIVLRRLCAHLLKENPLLGPALRVEARHLVQTGFSIAQALRESWLPLLDDNTCTQLVELAQAPGLHGGVWLLVDGLDEVQAENRRKIRELVARWPGPSITGARPLPNEVRGAPHVRVASLSEAQQQRLFELENKPGHWELVAEKSYDHLSRRPSDRRKEMLADLCSTPLGVSLLAMRPEAELGEQLDVPTVLRRSIGTLLERAEEAERISKPIRWRVVHQGLGILGAAAWSMIRRGESELTFEDLTKMEGPSEVVDAVYHVLDNSDLVQRVGTELYQFSHKSLAELCAAIHLHQRPEAEAELLSRVGEPGAEAVASHFAAQIQDPERLTAFIRQLTSNPHRPLSSLALATRLLVANGPGRLDTEVALEVLVRRVRLASHDFDHHWPALPGGLDDDGEMWLALGRWAQALRPHADTLVEACPPAMRGFLRGEPPPPLEPPYEVGRRLSPSMDFAERLALTLGMEVPLVVFTRMEKGSSVLMSRPMGPWLTELEALMDAGDEVYPGSEPITASVWAQRADEKRLLERLDALSRHAPSTLAPLLAAVEKNGRPEQKREALLRAALNSLELGERDNEGDWVVKASFARKTAALSSEQWLRQWEQLWGCGLVGEVSSRAQCLDPLYAEFIEDPCGPARWRALVALQHLESSTCPERFRAALHDEFRPVRIQALALLSEGGHAFDPAEAWLSLVSLDEHERWVAFEATGLFKTAPLELLLAVLSHEKTSPSEESSSNSRWLPIETPWEEAVRKLGENAHGKLIRAVHSRLEEYGYRAFADLMDGPHGEVVEELIPSWYGNPPTSFFLELLETKSPRQRRFAARRLHSQRQAEILAPYVEDADPEVARLARQSLEEQQETQRRQAEYKARHEAERQPSEDRWNRPILKSRALENLESFEALWKALSTHRLPHSIEEQIAYHREQKARETSLKDNEFEEPIESVSDRERKPFLKRLRQLYRPHHQSLLLTGLTDVDLVPFAMVLLREHLPVSDMLALIVRGGRLLESAVELLRGTPHASEAARRLREEALADRLRPEPDPYQYVHESAIASGYAAKEVRRRVISQLERLDGVAALLPWLEPGTPETFRRQTIEHLQGFIYSRWRHRAALNRPEVLDWARRASEGAQEEEVREIAFSLLSVLGDDGDAARCRSLLDDHDLPPRTLGIILRLYRRFASKSELPFFRTFLTHSPEAGSEAAAALVHLGGDSVLEELVQLLESPPPALDALPLIHHFVGWKLMVAEAIIRFGNGTQAKRLARLMAHDRDVWRVAARHIRLPEHLLFIAGHLGNKDPAADEDDGYDDARKVFEGMLRRVDEASAHRVMLEAMPWGYTFANSFEDFVSVRPEDTDLILSALRERPDNPLALSWLGSLAEAEELLDTLWREQGVPWW